MCKQEMSNPRDSYAIVVKGEQTCQSALADYLLVNRTVTTVPRPTSSCWHLVSRLTRHLDSLDESQVVGYRQKAASRGQEGGR